MSETTEGDRTYEEGHCKRVKDKYEEELEVMSSIWSQTGHPINTVHVVSVNFLGDS